MVKVVVENFDVVMNEEMGTMVVLGDEMERIVKKLPDWGKGVRKMIKEKYKGYKYWRDGVRIDGDFYMKKEEGDRKWILDYIHYRICGKGKRTLYRSVLREAVFVDSKGRVGCYKKDIYDKEGKIEGYDVVYKVSGKEEKESPDEAMKVA